MNRPRVLVTGGTGVLGWRVVERLGSQDIRARAFREGTLVCPDQAYGKIRWEDFLRSRIATGKEVTGR